MFTFKINTHIVDLKINLLNKTHLLLRLNIFC